MKTTSIITIAALLICVLGKAQTEKGTRIIGASIGSFNVNQNSSVVKYDNDSTIKWSSGSGFNIEINQSMSWFIKDNLALGASTYVLFSKNQYQNYLADNKGTFTTSSFSFAPHICYYFKSGEKNKTYVQISSGIYTGLQKTVITSFWGSTSSVNFGYEHFINSNVGFVASTGFTYNISFHDMDDSFSKKTGISKGFNVPVNVGLRIHLGPKYKEFKNTLVN